MATRSLPLLGHPLLLLRPRHRHGPRRRRHARPLRPHPRQFPSEQPLKPLLQKLLPSLLLLACIIFLAYSLRPQSSSPATPYDLDSFANLPVLHDGRVKPIESVARSTLLALRNKQSVLVTGKPIPPALWLLDVVTHEDRARTYPVFRIDHPDVRALLDPKTETQNTFSMNDLEPAGPKLGKEINQALQTEKNLRDAYQTKLLELNSKLHRYVELASLESLHAVPPSSPDQPWRNLHQVKDDFQKSSANFPPAAANWAAIFKAYEASDPQAFNHAVAQYANWLKSSSAPAFLPAAAAKARLETLFLHAAPFYQAVILYIVVFLLVCFSWLGWSKPLLNSAFWITLLAWLVHTFGVAARMYIHGRPPVTNLYASAVFVGWGCVLLALVLERLYRNGVGSQAAAILGFLTLIVALNLDSGETMEAVRAVLDSNFWLSTHVVVITIGYASTFLAGFLAVLYILRSLVPGTLDAKTGKNIARMVYGIICFSLLFSFVGTVLGGIWADQSWGRFWGWDPKENGALLIVLWNALILHARWAGLVRERALMALAVFGNVVTAWSWFGVNMLGIGLHSYGFMDKALLWLGVFVASQLLIIALALIPLAIQKIRDSATQSPRPEPPTLFSAHQSPTADHSQLLRDSGL